MSREDIQKLLGGYATDTLSEAERSALFAAALEDQELFDALTKEQALRDVLQDPAARQQLITALGPPRETFGARAWQWLRRPSTLAMAGAMAAILIVSGVALHRSLTVTRQEVKLAENLAPLPSTPPRDAPTRTEGYAADQVARAVVIAPKPRVGKAAGKLEPQLPPSAVAPPPPAPSKPLLSEKTEAAAGAAVQEFRAQNAMPMLAMKRANAALDSVTGRPVPYSLLREGADGAFSPVSAGTVFRAGDTVRVQAAPGDAGFLNLFQRGPTGNWSLLAAQPAEKGQRYVLPSSGGLQSDKPAHVDLLLVFSAHEQSVVPAFQNADGTTLPSTAGAQAVQKITLEFR
jgi:hypothetical protein